MSITEIRLFIKGRIAEIDSDLKEINDPFGDNEVSTRELSTGFKIIFQETSFVRGANYFTETYPVRVEIYDGSPRDIVESFDKLFDKTMNIRNQCINPSNVNAQQIFTDVITSGVSVEQTENNDYALIGAFNIEIRQDFSC